MKRTWINRIATLAFMVVAVSLVAGCGSDDNPAAPDPASDAPALPPMSSFTFSLDFFGAALPAADAQSLATGKPSQELLMAAGTEKDNWIAAVVRAIYVQLTMYAALEPPIGAFAVAIHSIPQKQEDGSWLWTYIFVDKDVEFSIFLYGTPTDDSVLWRMEVSADNGQTIFDHFVWFSGEALNDDSAGYWQFYEPTAPSTGVPSLRIDWENASPVDHRLTLVVNGVGMEDEGDWLEFHDTPAAGTIDHYDASEDLLSNITAYPNGSGSLTVPDYNDGLQACWDQQQKNTVCP